MMSMRISLSSSRALAGVMPSSASHFWRSLPTASSAVFTPTSAMMRMSVISSKKSSSSASAFSTRSSILPERLSWVRVRRDFSRPKNPFFSSAGSGSGSA